VTTSVKNKSLLLLGMPSWDISQPLHSLAVVAGIAREAGVSVTLRDANIDFYHAVSDEEKKYWSLELTHLWLSEEVQDELWNKYSAWLTSYLDCALREANPVLVAFSVNTWTRAFSVRAARYLKICRPDLPILFGGVDCFPGEYNRRFLQDSDDRYCDIICQGESEIALKKYLQELGTSGDWRATCPGFAYYDNGKLVDTGITELPNLKEEQPLPAFDLFDLSLYVPPGTLPFFLTRGCTYNCHFCSEKPNFRRFRNRTVEEAIRSLEAVLPYARPFAPVPMLYLADSNFSNHLKFLDEFLTAVIEKGIQIRWRGEAHIEKRIDRAFIDKLARSGLVSVFWGIETGSQHVIDLMNKRYDHQVARRILRETSDAGIAQECPIIVGFPGETAQDVAETIEFIFEYQDLPLLQFKILTQVMVPTNSPLFNRYADFGLANNHHHEWRTLDGKNTLPIRIVRRFVVCQAQDNRELSMDALVNPEEIAKVPINEVATAADLYDLLVELFSRSGRLPYFHVALDDWAAESLSGRPAIAFDDSRRDDPYFSVFTALDKDSPESRARLYRLILESLRPLKTNHSLPSPHQDLTGYNALHN